MTLDVAGAARNIRRAAGRLDPASLSCGDHDALCACRRCRLTREELAGAIAGSPGRGVQATTEAS